MYNEISAGVGIQVETTFRPDLSDLLEGTYFFNYRITIVNTNDFSIQLLHREWNIFDSLRPREYVSGAGVVGEQPILHAGQHFTYISGCQLSSEIGKMEGFYTFLNMQSGALFKSKIPKFDLAYLGKLN
jgi:ApaG protein